MYFWRWAKSGLIIYSDGNIRYLEYENDTFQPLSEYKSADPQRGIAFLPKRAVNMHENEVMRAFKTVNDSYIEPISFIVPRRAEVFQDDIYPPVVGTKPAMSSADWLAGAEALPPKISLESIYAGEEPAEVPADYKSASHAPPSPKASLPTKKEPESVKETSATLRGPPPSIKEQTSSIAGLASKFADKDADELEDDAEDDTSSFEEIAKPFDRSERNVHFADKTREKTPSSASLRELPGSSTSPTKEQPMTAAAQPTILAASQSNSSSRIASYSSLIDQSTPSNTATEQPIQGYLHEIKSLLEEQTKTMAAQSDKINQLTAEVDTLKTTVTVSKDERIRELERELATLRS